MKSIVRTVASLLLGAGIAIGVAQASPSPSYGYTGHESTGALLSETVVFKPVETDPRGVCEGGAPPRCYRDVCPSTDTCPAQDQCSGKASCFLIRRYDGKLNCSMSGSCRPSSGSVVIQ